MVRNPKKIFKKIPVTPIFGKMSANLEKGRFWPFSDPHPPKRGGPRNFWFVRKLPKICVFKHRLQRNWFKKSFFGVFCLFLKVDVFPLYFLITILRHYNGKTQTFRNRQNTAKNDFLNQFLYSLCLKTHILGSFRTNQKFLGPPLFGGWGSENGQKRPFSKFALILPKIGVTGIFLNIFFGFLTIELVKKSWSEPQHQRSPKFVGQCYQFLSYKFKELSVPYENMSVQNRLYRFTGSCFYRIKCLSLSVNC